VTLFSADPPAARLAMNQEPLAAFPLARVVTGEEQVALATRFANGLREAIDATRAMPLSERAERATAFFQRLCEEQIAATQAPPS
jgi:hypothetical protein